MLARRIPATARVARAFSTSSAAGKERLVILGSGWGGYNLARKADKSLYDVTVVSPNSYFSFTPFLASTCVGTLEFGCATEPVRGIKRINYAQAWAQSIDLASRTVRVAPALPPLNPTEHDVPANVTSGAEMHAAYSPGDAYDVPFDKLVVATGCRSASFNTPGVAEYAHFLKDVREARAIRYTLLQNLELASEPGITPEEKRRLLSFRVVGGGPTGVEFAAELHDFVKADVYRLYPHLKDQITITLYDLAPGILQSFDASLRAYAERKFSRQGVDVRGNSKIVSVGKDHIEIEREGAAERVPYGLLVWNTGLQANEFIDTLPGLDKDPKTKSLKVDPHLRVCDGEGKPLDGVFAIGDNATPNDGHRLPATAQVASQMAGYMATTLKAVGKGTALDNTPPFRWKDHGSMVFIGDYRAMVDRSKSKDDGPRARLSGFVAWIVWRSYYVTLAMGWRNKILIPVYWTLAMFFGRDVTNF